MKVRLIYKGRSGRFKHGKTYNTTWSCVGRGGSKSSSTWLFTLKSRLKIYRITPYEFSKFWRYEDRAVIMTMCLKELYSGSKDYMLSLIYKDNPILSMIPKVDPFKDAYYPVPILYP